MGTKNGKQKDKTKIGIFTKRMGPKKWEANSLTKKNWQLRKMVWDEKMGSKQIHVKNRHLTKMDWEQKMGSKKIQQKLASLKKRMGPKKWEANRST